MSKKRYLYLFLWIQILILTASFTIPGYADNTTLYTSVPGYHTIEYDVGSGKVVINNTTYTGKGSLKVERLSNVSLHFTAPNGYVISHIYKDGTDITASVSDGYYTIKGINTNCKFVVTYNASSSSDSSSSSSSSSSSPKTGDSSNVLFYSVLSFSCLAALIYLKKTKETKGEQ